MARSRTNIEIEDTYVAVIMDRYGASTKTEAVDLALRHLAGLPKSREEALAAGVTPSGMVGCMIAAVAWRRGATLLHQDADPARVAFVVTIPTDPASRQTR